MTGQDFKFSVGDEVVFATEGEVIQRQKPSADEQMIPNEPNYLVRYRIDFTSPQRQEWFSESVLQTLASAEAAGS